MADRPGWHVPNIVTGGWSYIRFHQGRATHPAYSRRKLRAWARRIAGLDARDVFAFFNNDAMAAAPSDAAALMEVLVETDQEVALPAGR
jgi:uncharacterized protein YecE (DUF72 family)